MFSQLAIVLAKLAPIATYYIVLAIGLEIPAVSQ